MAYEPQQERLQCRRCESDRLRIYRRRSRKFKDIRAMLVNCENCGASYDEMTERKKEQVLTDPAKGSDNE